MKLRDEIIGQNFVLDADDEKRNTSLFSVQGKICSVDVSWFLFFCFKSFVSGIRGKGQIIRQFTRLHLRGMELANILSEWLRNPGKRTSGSQNWKNFPGGTCPRTPPRILSLWSSFWQSVSIYPRSDPPLPCILSIPLNPVIPIVTVHTLNTESHPHFAFKSQRSQKTY